MMEEKISLKDVIAQRAEEIYSDNYEKSSEGHWVRERTGHLQAQLNAIVETLEQMNSEQTMAPTNIRVESSEFQTMYDSIAVSIKARILNKLKELACSRTVVDSAIRLNDKQFIALEDVERIIKMS